MAALPQIDEHDADPTLEGESRSGQEETLRRLKDTDA